MSDDLLKEDEIIEVKLPMRDYKILREVIEREKTWNWITKWLKSGFMWTVIGTIIILLTFWEQIKKVFA